MDKAEIVKLREFLRRSFGAPTLQVAPNSKSGEAADVSLGERNLGQQVLEIVIFGYATPQDAELALRRQVGNLIRT